MSQPAEPLRAEAPEPASAEGEPIVGHIANFGFMRLNWDGPSPHDKTLIITGIEPSDGAAIIANAVRQLGVPVFFFPIGAGFKGGDGLALPWGGFSDRAKKLAQQYGMWGARVPFRRNMLAAAKRAVDEPHLILVMEDAASIALAIEQSAEGGGSGALAGAAERILEITLFAAETRLPAFVLSLQKAREFAPAHIDALAAFIGITPSPEARLAAVALIDQGARSINQTVVGMKSVQGALDKSFKRGRVTGWAKEPWSNERIRVRALVNGVDAGEAMADQLRNDLVKHKIGDGHHGFTIDVSQLLAAEVQTVQVFAVDDNALIGTAAMTKDTGAAIG